MGALAQQGADVDADALFRRIAALEYQAQYLNAIGGVISGVTVKQAIASAYKFFLPGSQFVGSGNAKDLSGNNADATIDSGTTDAAVWANKGYITTAAATNGGLYVPAAKATYNLATQSLILAFVMNDASAAPTNYLFGNGNGGSDGIFINADSAKLNLQICTNGGSITTSGPTAATVRDGTDHAVLVALNAVTKSASVYVDGILSNTFANAFSGTTAPTLNFYIGSVPGQAAFAAKFNGIHLLTFTGALPGNLNLIAAKHAAGPRNWFVDGDFQ